MESNNVENRPLQSQNREGTEIRYVKTEPLWVEHPSVLLQPRLWPIHPTETLDSTINAISRTLLVAGVGLSFLQRSSKAVLMALVLTLGITLFSRFGRRRALQSTPIDTDEFFKREGNIEGNPLVYDQPNAVAAQKPAPELLPDDVHERKFGFIGEELPMQLFTNPLPDPTLMARPVSFQESSEAHRPITGGTYSLFRRDDDMGRMYF